MKYTSIKVDQLFLINGILQGIYVLQKQLIEHDITETEVWSNIGYMVEYLESLKSEISANIMLSSYTEEYHG